MVVDQQQVDDIGESNMQVDRPTPAAFTFTPLAIGPTKLADPSRSRNGITRIARCCLRASSSASVIRSERCFENVPASMKFTFLPYPKWVRRKHGVTTTKVGNESRQCAGQTGQE